jgi:hypothetical protein
MSDRLQELARARRRGDAVRALRAMRSASPAPARERPAPSPLVEHCDLCGTTVPDDHRHLLQLVERQILCSCEACWALRSGDAELMPVGTRTLWLEDFDLPDELWGAFRIPVGLAFFLRSGGLAGRVAALYPSPAGATECELEFADWDRLVAANPVLEELQTDVEALLVNRLSEPNAHAIVPIDECYRLVGLIKAGWEGISGGAVLDVAVPAFFAELRAKAPA